jgi:hypothetical protein
MQIGHRLALGLIGGAIGLGTMEILRRISAPLVKKRAKQPTDVFLTERTMSPLGPKHEPGEGETEALGRILYERVTGRAPSPRAKTALSWAVHLAYGLGVAAVYGIVRGGGTRHALRDGALFGAGLWLFGDELAVPLLGLSDKPTTYPVSRHAQALAQHLGFGIATVATTRKLEDWL